MAVEHLVNVRCERTQRARRASGLPVQSWKSGERHEKLAKRFQSKKFEERSAHGSASVLPSIQGQKPQSKLKESTSAHCSSEPGHLNRQHRTHTNQKSSKNWPMKSVIRYATSTWYQITILSFLWLHFCFACFANAGRCYFVLILVNYFCSFQKN